MVQVKMALTLLSQDGTADLEDVEGGQQVVLQQQQQQTDTQYSVQQSAMQAF
jgi:hypothetical protein